MAEHPGCQRSARTSVTILERMNAFKAVMNARHPHQKLLLLLKPHRLIAFFLGAAEQIFQSNHTNWNILPERNRKTAILRSIAIEAERASYLCVRFREY